MKIAEKDTLQTPDNLYPNMDRTESAGPSAKTWEAMKPHIHERYIKEGRTLVEVMEIMRTKHSFNASRKMYNTHFTKWGSDFDKNKKRGRSRTPTRPSKGRRTRPKALYLPLPKSAHVSRSASSVLPALTPYPYRKTQIALVSIANYTDDILKPFSQDPFTVVSPNNSYCQTRTWKHLADQIWGATQLMMNGSMAKGMSAFSMACNQLWRSGAVQNSDPAMMVKFWRICYRLYKTERTINSGVYRTDELRRQSILMLFLSYLRQLAGIYLTKQHPLLQLLNAVYKTPHDELLGTLEVGYRRTIDAMESRLGQEHLIVLEMRSNYFKYWSNESSARSMFMQRYPAILATAEQQYGRTGEKTVRVLHDLVYALNYNVKDRNLTTKFALDALERAKATLCRQTYPTWGMTTQTYAFTAKLLATMSLEDGQLEECRGYLEDAITTLERGDRECRTRAVILADIQTRVKAG